MFVFPDYFSPIKEMFVTNANIIVLSYEERDNHRKAVILDLEGNLKKETFVPISDWFDFSDKYFYFLKPNPDEEFDLHCIQL